MNTDTIEAKLWLEQLLKAIVSEPNECFVECIESHAVTVLVPHCAPVDAGRLIGQKGAVFIALKEIVERYFACGGSRFQLSRIAADAGDRKIYPPKKSQDWDTQSWIEIFGEFVRGAFGQYAFDCTGHLPLVVTYYLRHNFNDWECGKVARNLNALGNALAWTLRGEVVVSVECEQ